MKIDETMRIGSHARQSVGGLLAVAVLVVHSLATVATADEWTLLDGTRGEGQITSIDAAGKIAGQNVPADLLLDALRKIDRTAPDTNAKGNVVLELVGGGRIQGDSITVENEKFHLVWPLGEKLALPLEVVRAVRLKPSVKDDLFEDALTKPVADNDRLFVEIEGKLTILEGLVESLTAENVVFQFGGQKQTLPTEKLYGIVVAQVGKPGKANVSVELADGSRIPGTLKELADGKLSVSVGTASISVPWTAVKSLGVRSSRLAFLSDLEPVEVDESRVVTLPQPWQRDKNVLQKTITLGERKFDRGIGTHSYSKLVFDIGRQYDNFSTVIGIDAAAERKGDCVFVVLADGKEIARERMTGASEAKELKLAVTGVKQLALVVEPGEELDLADLADWADARVIKTK